MTVLSALICAGLADAPAASAQVNAIEAIEVKGNQRIEPDTVRSYLAVAPGDAYSAEKVDQSLKNLFDTGLFADVTITRSGDLLTINVVENPIINRIAFEGNKKLDNEKLGKELRLRPRVVYTRAKVRADVQRMIELYRRSGRFAATIEPKVIQLPQNRVDIVFEISEGPKTTVSKINFIGNKEFSSGDLRGALATRESRWWRFLTSDDTYDPDRLAYDREQLRQYYLSKGYADFRVNAAVAELSPDLKDFYIAFTIEEGEIYDFGEINVESEIRDLDPAILRPLVKTKQGKRYNAKLIDQTIEKMTEVAGDKGYAFVDIRPRVRRDKKGRLINITYRVSEAPRVYVERIDIHGNARTLDKVIRREFRLSEGDAFNNSRIKRSRQRIKALGFFKEAEIEQVAGSSPDRTVVDVQVQEQSTGELSLNVGFSSIENFIAGFGITERNLLGRGQTLRANFSISSIRTQIDLGFTEPYFMDRPIAAGADLFARSVDYRQYSSFLQKTVGGSLRAAFPITEHWTMGVRYTIRQDQVEGRFDTANNIYLAAALGTFTTSSVGYSLIYDNVDDRMNPTSGRRFVLSQDIAGLGGTVSYVRSTASLDQYIPLVDRWVLKLAGEGGYIRGLGEGVRLNDRFFNTVRGFEPRGVGPRDRPSTDSLGGNIYYTGTAELLVPLGSAANELGLKSSIFLDVGALYKVDDVNTIDPDTGFLRIIGDSNKPRVSIGVGFSWNSPFGPFRIDFAKALMKSEFDKTEFFQFNISNQF
ncbi:outer membrane protein assembly factor BamA [Govanella unica]|uniref:Outer membrane protein assembly factor BamA n=1 Tax=Govanella unica TaxID=2975056 RepID=A0A9X3Z7A5_9PROT|nr:outer membrane protein assembly factor BamA [Govania unica]MDA5193774.1 outer membrane protein assembly factor BamA [Govania unica]